MQHAGSRASHPIQLQTITVLAHRLLAARRKQGQPPYPGPKQGRPGERESNQDRPQPGEEIAEVFTDAIACIVVKGLEDDLNCLTASNTGSGIPVDLAQVG